MDSKEVHKFNVKSALSHGLLSSTEKDKVPPIVSVVMIAAALCVIVCILIYKTPDPAMIDYPLLNDVANYNCHVQQFDAFQKHQFPLDIVPDSRLAALDNPYDSQLRNTSEIPYLWDRAYFNGKYYSYFGIAPLILAYEPVYIIFGKLPDIKLATGIISMITVILLWFALCEMIRNCCQRASLLHSILSYWAVITGGLVLLPLVVSDQYYIEYQCMMAAVSGMIFFTLRQADPSKKANGIFYFFCQEHPWVSFYCRGQMSSCFAWLFVPRIFSGCFVIDSRLQGPRFCLSPYLSCR